jgi:peptide/nickel transport system substrate-binding protein
VNYAINREELWKYAAKGNAYDLGGFIPTGGYGHNPNLELYTYDTTKARKLLAEAGYSDGFELTIITGEAWKLEAQIISTMLERIGLKTKLEVLKMPQFYRKVYIPLLERPPEEQDWDIAVTRWPNHFAHTGATFLTFGFTEESDLRWIEYDPIYEKMWKDMANTRNPEAQEKKIQKIGQYIYDHAYSLFIYTPLDLYAVNKEVDFVPQKLLYLRLKETSVTDRHWSIKGENQ